MKILIAGLGHIAARHIQNIKQLKPKAKISVLRQKSKNADLGHLAPFVTNIFFDAKEALAWQPRVTVITNPAPFHIRTALPFAAQGSHLFIEKPLSSHFKDIERLKHISRKNKLTVMVGYVMRFSEPIQFLKRALAENRIGQLLTARCSVGRHLSHWRPQKDYRLSVSSQRALGGGVLLELSHELDYILWLMGKVRCVRAEYAKLSHLDIDVEDSAEIILKFASGAVANIHLDMIDHGQNRSCRMIGTEGTLSWNLEDQNRVRLHRNEEKTEFFQMTPWRQDKMYLNEFHHFFECVEHQKTPLITLEEGQDVLKLVTAIQQSAKLGRSIRL